MPKPKTGSDEESRDPTEMLEKIHQMAREMEEEKKRRQEEEEKKKREEEDAKKLQEAIDRVNAEIARKTEEEKNKQKK
jgi:hypothetical protein